MPTFVVGDVEQKSLTRDFGFKEVFKFLVAVNFWNFFGAGVMGIIINLPIMNYFEHGTYLTVNHGHAALMGVYGNISLAALLFAGRAGTSLTAEIGLFARAGFSSPNLETNAFTDSDRSVSAGVSVSGKLWNRPDDTFAVAGLINHISAQRIAYLDAGGLTAIIGDGRLPNPGNEYVLETYYTLPVYSWKLTADYQFIANPAFNRDRGPAHFIATRLRTQF